MLSFSACHLWSQVWTISLPLKIPMSNPHSCYTSTDITATAYWKVPQWNKQSMSPNKMKYQKHLLAQNLIQVCLSFLSTLKFILILPLPRSHFWTPLVLALSLPLVDGHTAVTRQTVTTLPTSNFFMFHNVPW